ncbi:MAG: hypothetical protein N4A45_06890 [Flavobacteriales bacterium]|jgi:hypothetical protein|nr:hypothetical protein [Flavobacteriales bacterium]
MIDFIKFRTEGKADFLINNHALNYRSSIKTYTGEIIDYPYKMHKDYKSFKIDIHPLTFYTKGTFHKYLQNGENWKDFSIYDFKTAVQGFEKEFGLDIENSTIHFIEYGVNMTVPFNPNLDNLRKIFISYKGRPFQPLRSNTTQCIGLECVFSQYRIKLYSKTLQYNLKENVIRFEIQVSKMQKIGTKDLRIKDLYSEDLVITKMKIDLVNVMERMIVFDEKIKAKTINEELFLSQVSNPNYWAGLNPKSFFKQKQKYMRIVESRNAVLHSSLITLVKDKCNDLSFKNEENNLPFNISGKKFTKEDL